MEGEAVRRRFTALAAHFAFVRTAFARAVASSLPLNCSASLNSAAIPRCDNGMCFARQGSDSQALRGGTSDAPKCWTSKTCLRPLQIDCRSIICPEFARPIDRVSRETQADSRTKMLPPRVVQGTGWAPKMDVAESGKNYILSVEIPGVRSKDPRVKVSEKIITVSGIRSAQATYRFSGFPNDSMLSFHKTEIARGPYEVVWPLPMNANRDRVSAEVADGFLQILAP